MSPRNRTDPKGVNVPLPSESWTRRTWKLLQSDEDLDNRDRTIIGVMTAVSVVATLILLLVLFVLIF